MRRIAVFVLATAVLAWISRRSLRSGTSHGFFRFFTWEAILVLTLLNFRGLDAWFGDPVSVRQLASWTLLGASLVVLALGVRGLRTRGRPDPASAREAELLSFEKTTRLVTDGVYGYIRHPMYASLLYLTWGVFLKRPDWPGGLLAAAASVLLYATARAEEAEDARWFGQSYRAYMARTKRFVPFLF